MSAPHLPPVAVGPAMASDVYTQSQETTVSTLTAFTSIVDLSVVGEKEDPELVDHLTLAMDRPSLSQAHRK